jgi:HEAT repeats
VEGAGLTHYCYHCYGENELAAGRCTHCGEEIQAPPSTSYGQLLIWALHHPIAEVAVNAAATLGERRERLASDSLRELVFDSRDPYLAAQALRSLVHIEGTTALGSVLEQLLEQGPVQVQAVASAALRGELE